MPCADRVALRGSKGNSRHMEGEERGRLQLVQRPQVAGCSVWEAGPGVLTVHLLKMLP